MNLTKALKQKKKLIKKADEFYSRFSNSNSFETDQEQTYDPQIMYNSWLSTTQELVNLKTKIQIANQPIAHKIFELGELKNLVSRMKKVDTKTGLFRRGYSEEKSEYSCWMDQIQKDQLISNWEEKIDALQEEIEAFNALTKI